jgi:hypothetical protein
MSDAVVRWAKKHTVALVVAVFTAGTLYAKVTADMNALQKNNSKLEAEQEILLEEVQLNRVKIERALAILETAFPPKGK